MAEAGLLTLVCTVTGGEIDTHALYTRADLERVKNAELNLHCKFCHKRHVFRFADALLKPKPGKSPTP